MADVDLRDMMLEAGADAQSLWLEFQKEMAAPQMRSKFAHLWTSLPDEIKERFAKEQPDAYAALIENLK